MSETSIRFLQELIDNPPIISAAVLADVEQFTDRMIRDYPRSSKRAVPVVHRVQPDLPAGWGQCMRCGKVLQDHRWLGSLHLCR